MMKIDEKEIIRVRQRIEEFLANDRRLKTELKENSRTLQIAEEMETLLNKAQKLV